MERVIGEYSKCLSAAPLETTNRCNSLLFLIVCLIADTALLCLAVTIFSAVSFTSTIVLIEANIVIDTVYLTFSVDYGLRVPVLSKDDAGQRGNYKD